MSDNILQTLQTAMQDVIAPDVRELKVRVSSQQEQSKVQFEALQHQITGVEGRFSGIESRITGVESRITSAAQQSEAQYKSILAAIGQNKAESELATMRTIAALSECVAVLEATRH